jgi:hypothetical protein
LQIPTNFSSTILKAVNLNLSVSSSLTDSGMCTTLNGKTISETYNDNGGRIGEFIKILGTHKNAPLKGGGKISGSGNIHQKKLWLNVRDATLQKETQGQMSVAINDWRDYASVR